MAREPIAVLLLPVGVEQLDAGDPARVLLRARGVVAIEPGRLPFAAGGRAARAQARRLLRRLPGRPVVLVSLDARQAAVAAALAERVTGAEVWDGPVDEPHTALGRLAQRGVDVSRS